MYSYTVSKSASENEFSRTCSMIESNFKGISKEEILEDMDGTTIQIYHTGKSTIKVFNDYEVDAVYVDSDVDLKGII